MKLLHARSLAATIDAIDDRQWRGEGLNNEEALEAALWLADRQGKPGCYGGMFAPTASDRREARVFTGERFSSGAQVGHVLGEETSRCLRSMNVRNAAVAAALDRANENMLARLREVLGNSKPSGSYCCAFCSVSFWRNLAAGSLDQQEARLADGMRFLSEHEQPDGTWRRFPFYYTLLALEGIEGSLPLGNLRHAAPRCERLLKRRTDRAKYPRRRRELLERVLVRVGG